MAGLPRGSRPSRNHYGNSVVSPESCCLPQDLSPPCALACPPGIAAILLAFLSKVNPSLDLGTAFGATQGAQRNIISKRWTNPKEIRQPKGRQTNMGTEGLGAARAASQLDVPGWRQTHTGLTMSKRKFRNIISAKSSSRR